MSATLKGIESAYQTSVQLEDDEPLWFIHVVTKFSFHIQNPCFTQYPTKHPHRGKLTITNTLEALRHIMSVTFQSCLLRLKTTSTISCHTSYRLYCIYRESGLRFIRVCTLPMNVIKSGCVLIVTIKIVCSAVVTIN